MGVGKAETQGDDGMIRSVATGILGEVRAGALKYRLRPSSGRAWGGPFNGQAWRCRLIAEIILKTDPVAIVETGTYLGTTTEWLSAFQIPVWSCEVSAINFGFAHQRLAMVPHVKIVHNDSRAALQEILDGPLKSNQLDTILFYLDAHWNDDLPLAEELEIVFAVCPRAIVVVDDFQVPGDPGYGFSDFGKNKALTMNYIVDIISTYQLATYYPSISSDRETGAKRGCSIIAKANVAGDVLSNVSLLRLA